MDSGDIQLRHNPLGAFVDVKSHGELVIFALIVFLDDRGHLYIAKAVRFIQIGNRFFIAIPESFAVTPASELERSGLKNHPLPKRAGSEIIVSLNRNMFQFLALAPLNKVFDCLLVFLGRKLAECYIDVRIAFGLEVIAQVTRTFNQKIAVYRAFLIDGHVFFEFSLRNLCPHRFHRDLRPRIDIECWLRPPALRNVFHRLQGDGCPQAILALVLLLDILQP